MPDALTQEAIERLKQEWAADPCWDIEDTEGFEAVREALAKFHEEWTRKREEAKIQRLYATAERLGMPGNLTLAEQWDRLERRLHEMEMRITGIEYR